MLAIPRPQTSVPISISWCRLKRSVRGPINTPWMTTPIRPMKAKTQPLSISLHPRPPLSGDIDVNSMNVPCIMVNPNRKRKWMTTRVEMVGRRRTEVRLVTVPPKRANVGASEWALDSAGRLSGSCVNARKNAISDIALEKRQGSRYG